MSPRRRLDLEIVKRKLANSRTQAQLLIREGKVRVAGAPADNPARMVAPNEAVTLVGPPPRFVSRGGEKLEGALIKFNVDITGARALDVGASTGGFTDCMLQRGASSVVALDVGHGQLHEKIRADQRVDVRERMNIRHVTLSDFDDNAFDLISVDVSFISLRTISPVVLGQLAASNANLFLLVKPQFEAGKAVVSKGRGVITSPEVWRDVIEKVIASVTQLKAATMGLMVSPILGAEGNVEFLLWLRAQNFAESEERQERQEHPQESADSPRIRAMIDDVVNEAAALTSSKGDD